MGNGIRYYISCWGLNSHQASMATGDSRRATDGLLLTRRKLLTMSQRMREKCGRDLIKL